MKDRDKNRLSGFRKKLKKVREEKGMSLRQLSYNCDIDYAKISKLESNSDTNLNLTTLFELARGLGIHPKELIDYDFDFVKFS